MSLTPFRFVHATNVRLDEPLWGIGAVDGPARRLAEEATNLAFEQIVAACIEQDAAFLLLTGNTFDAAHAHRARMLLEQACERLAEHNCQVFLAPGESDPPHTWNGGVGLPPGCRVFLTPHDEPQHIVRDGITLASVAPYHDRQMTTSGATAGLRIGLVGGRQHSELQTLLSAEDDQSLDIRHLERYPSLASFGYLALGSGSQRVTVRLPQGLAHDPGCPQPLDGRQTTALGCTLIDVDHDAQPTIRLLPTAIVRREEIALALPAEMDWDGLVAAMQTALVERDPLPTEKLWLVRWMLEGDGDLVDSLIDPEARQELTELVESELDDDGPLLRMHEVELAGGWAGSIDVSQGGSVYEEFNTLFDEQAASRLSQFRRGLAARDWPEAAWVRHIVDAAEQVREVPVIQEGRSLARRHLIGEGTPLRDGKGAA